MTQHIHIQMVDASGQRGAAQLPAAMAQALQLHEGDVLHCSIQHDRSLHLARCPADPPPPADKKGGR